MVIAHSIIQQKARSGKLWIVLPVMYAVLFMITLASYIQWQSVNFIMGVLAIPIVAKISPGRFSYRYGIAAFILAIITLLLPIGTLTYFSLLFAVLFVTESWWGKTSNLLMLILVFLSPVFQYFINVFSFPIRLYLTEGAGRLLYAVNVNTIADGNTILYNGNEFSVDPACMGLNMLLLSMIIAVVLIAHHQQKNKTKISGTIAGIVLGMVLLLNIAANLVRIICMVQFTILPGTISHELTGLIFLVAYVIVPLHFIIRRIVKKYGKYGETVNRSTVIASGTMKMSVHALLFVLLSAACFKNIHQRKMVGIPEGQRLTVPGYTVQSLPHHIVKLEKEKALIYVKRIEAFYNADHTPYICWRGSGYSFRNIKMETIGSLQVYSGKLENNTDTLFTAWWYQRAGDCTVNQFDWRWKMLKGGGSYSVVNITTATKEELVQEISIISRNQPFIRLLK